MPHIVLQFCVLIKRYGFVIEFRTIEAAYETRIFQCVIFFLFFLSQIAKRINYYTKNQIQCYNNDDEKKQKIIDYAEIIQGLLEYKNKNL